MTNKSEVEATTYGVVFKIFAMRTVLDIIVDIGPWEIFLANC